MDVTKTIVNYPTRAIAYFGVGDGRLYKSTNGMQTWNLIYTFPNAIVEIMASDTNSNNVVVGEKHGVWVSHDGGSTWTKSLDTPS